MTVNISCKVCWVNATHVGPLARNSRWAIGLGIQLQGSVHYYFFSCTMGYTFSMLIQVLLITIRVSKNVKHLRRKGRFIRLTRRQHLRKKRT